MRVLATCLIVHVLLAGIIPSSWWVPDVTLVGLILAIARAPRQWLVCPGLAGVLMMAWAVRYPQLILIGYLGLGGAVRLLARQWDTNDLRVQYVTVSSASLLMSLGTLWLDDLWSLPLLGLVGARMLVTTMTLPLIRRLLERRSGLRAGGSRQRSRALNPGP